MCRASLVLYQFEVFWGDCADIRGGDGFASDRVIVAARQEAPSTPRRFQATKCPGTPKKDRWGGGTLLGPISQIYRGLSGQDYFILSVCSDAAELRHPNGALIERIALGSHLGASSDWVLSCAKQVWPEIGLFPVLVDNSSVLREGDITGDSKLNVVTTRPSFERESSASLEGGGIGEGGRREAGTFQSFV